MSHSREEILEERHRLKAEYRQLYDNVQALLLRHDPIGINFEENTDEYDPEVGTILPRLRTCASAEDVCRVVHEEFVRWFDASTAGSREHYAKIAMEIWDLQQSFQNAEPSDLPNDGPATSVDTSDASGGGRHR